MPASTSSVPTARFLRRLDPESRTRVPLLPLMVFLVLPFGVAHAQDVTPEECVALLRKLEQRQELSPTEQADARICIDRIRSAPAPVDADDSKRREKRLPLKVFR